MEKTNKRKLFNFYKIYPWMLKDKDISWVQCNMVAVINSFHEKDKYCNYSIDSWCKVLKVSRGTVIANLQELTRSGHIVTETIACSIKEFKRYRIFNELLFKTRDVTEKDAIVIYSWMIDNLDLNLTETGVFALIHKYDIDGCSFSATELGEIFNIDRTHAHRILRTLLSKKYIVKIEEPYRTYYKTLVSVQNLDGKNN